MWHTCRDTLVVEPGMVGLAPKWVRLAPAPNTLKSNLKKPRICPIWGQSEPLWTWSQTYHSWVELCNNVKTAIQASDLLCSNDVKDIGQKRIVFFIGFIVTNKTSFKYDGMPWTMTQFMSMTLCDHLFQWVWEGKGEGERDEGGGGFKSSAILRDDVWRKGD